MFLCYEAFTLLKKFEKKRKEEIIFFVWIPTLKNEFKEILEAFERISTCIFISYPFPSKQIRDASRTPSPSLP